MEKVLLTVVEADDNKNQRSVNYFSTFFFNFVFFKLTFNRKSREIRFKNMQNKAQLFSLGKRVLKIAELVLYLFLKNSRNFKLIHCFKKQ